MPSRRNLIELTPEEQQQLLEESKTLQVASIGPKGYPHLVAMWFVVVDGKICFTTFGKSQKVLNLQRNPKITCMVESGVQYDKLKGLVIEGTAEIVNDVDFTSRVMALVGAKMSGQPLGSVEVIPNKQAPKRVVVRVNPERIVSWDHSKLGGVY